VAFPSSILPANQRLYFVAGKVAPTNLVNLLLTTSIKVNVPVSDVSRLMTTGDDHEVQESASDPWTLVVAVRPWLERRRRHWLIEFRPFSADFSGISDDLRLGVDRLFASAVGRVADYPSHARGALRHAPLMSDSQMVNRY
jgi:hypothetical protein